MKHMEQKKMLKEGDELYQTACDMREAAGRLCDAIADLESAASAASEDGHQDVADEISGRLQALQGVADPIIRKYL